MTQNNVKESRTVTKVSITATWWHYGLFLALPRYRPLGLSWVLDEEDYFYMQDHKSNLATKRSIIVEQGQFRGNSVISKLYNIIFQREQ